MKRDYTFRKIYHLLKEEEAEHDTRFMGDCMFLLLLCAIVAAGLAFVVLEGIQ